MDPTKTKIIIVVVALGLSSSKRDNLEDQDVFPFLTIPHLFLMPYPSYPYQCCICIAGYDGTKTSYAPMPTIMRVKW